MSKVATAASGTGMFVAVLLNQPIRGQAVYRTLYFLPVITPTVAAGVVWKYLFDPSQGVVNRSLAGVGIEGVAVAEHDPSPAFDHYDGAGPRFSSARYVHPPMHGGRAPASVMHGGKQPARD